MADKNKWCCRLMSLGTGTIIIAVVYSIFNIVEIAGAAYRLNPHRKFDDLIIWGEPVTRSQLTIFLVIASTQAVCGVLVVFGAKKENPWLVLPWLIVECIVATVTAVICIAVIGKPNILLTVGFIFYVAVNGYCLTVVYSFYQALRKKRKLLRGGENAVM